MTPYQRLFGTGPRGLLISGTLLAAAWYLKDTANLPEIIESNTTRLTIFSISVMTAGVIAIWSFRVMPVTQRGNELITTGAYQYFRHPLYASLISSFNFGLAVVLNNWIFIIWALLLHPIWHWNVQKEEELMQQQFGDAYKTYCSRTGRFIPRVQS